MKMKSLAVGMVAGVLSISVLAAGQPETFDYKVNCSTKKTPPSGAGKSCMVDQCHNVPSGYVYVQSTFDLSVVSKSGELSLSEACTWWATQYREVIKGTGIKQPTHICLRAKAASRSGMKNMYTRGWADCRLRGEYIKLP